MSDKAYTFMRLTTKKRLDLKNECLKSGKSIKVV